MLHSFGLTPELCWIWRWQNIIIFLYYVFTCVIPLYGTVRNMKQLMHSFTKVNAMKNCGLYHATKHYSQFIGCSFFQLLLYKIQSSICVKKYWKIEWGTERQGKKIIVPPTNVVAVLCITRWPVIAFGDSCCLTITSTEMMFSSPVPKRLFSELHGLAIAKANVLEALFSRFSWETETFAVAPGCGPGAAIKAYMFGEITVENICWTWYTTAKRLWLGIFLVEVGVPATKWREALSALLNLPVDMIV